MGTLIETVAIATPSYNQIGVQHNSTKLAADAAIHSIQKANLNPEQIEILINTGIYRTDNIGEPAMAAVIQDLIKAHPFGIKKKRLPPKNQTFSFDLMNGGCGFINAIQLIDGLMNSGSLHKGIIVTADVEPRPGFSEGYSFAPIAAALILKPGKKNQGFIQFGSDTYLEYKDRFTGQLVFSKSRQKSLLILDQTETYLDACIRCSNESINKFLETNKLNINDIDLIIPSQTPQGLPDALNQISALEGKVVIANTDLGELHTAGPAFALEKIWSSQQYNKAQNILFVTVSAGITTAVALYRK
ncbi:MAG: hypothetical protein HOD92_24995 [Deltaproteobacteria bacterium]|jgi:3-oxoacyl-[acyl-carrier-protein] synthase III|nr:hypothetical protein [Deltaproteobacteria bacterium]